MSERLHIGIIGGGIAGISAAHKLSQKHDVTLFDKNDYLGGHTNTQIIQSGVDTGTKIDTGFIVMNDRTYPLFHSLLKEWGVPYRYSDMSFGYWDKKEDFHYAYTNLNGILSQRKNLFSLKFWKLSYELTKFVKKGTDVIVKKNEFFDMTLREFIKKEGFSQDLQEKYLLPMGSAIWSIPSDKLLEFPALSFLHFFERHGLLNLVDRPRWQTIEGGSQEYVKAFKRNFKGKILINHPVIKIYRSVKAPFVVLKNEEILKFDKIVIATHADEALNLLADPTYEEHSLLSEWLYESNRTVLHTDTSIMPPHRRAWSSWNFHRKEGQPLCTVTYHMNRLQGLQCHHDYFVTLNAPQAEIAPKKIIREFLYHHPIYTKRALQTQEHLSKLNGQLNTYYAGSYFGYGFHEDAVKSGLRIEL